MRLTYEQVKADNDKMKQFVAERIPGDGTRIDLGGGGWADLIPLWDDEYGWDLVIETDEPEWVGLSEIYRYLRRKEMTSREWWAEIEGETNRWRVHTLEREVSKLRRELTELDATRPQDYGATIDDHGLPREVSTAEAARILGVSKDTVLKLKEAGLLEYRNMAPPTSVRPVYAFSLKSVLMLRTTYETDVPMPYREKEPRRRAIRAERNFKHLKVDY